MEAEPKDLGQEHHTTQTLAFADTMGEVKDEQPPSWSTATADMKFEYLLYGHREQLACQVCGKTFPDESRLAYVHGRPASDTAARLGTTCPATRLSAAPAAPPADPQRVCLQEAREASLSRAALRL